MHLNQWFLCVTVGILFLSQPILSEEDDDEFKGPLMKVKPDGSMYTTAELIEMEGCKSETHEVTTSDGYIITIFRAYKTNPASSVPVLLQHGLLVSSDAWILENTSLTYRLVEKGYDVWLANIRGNTYGRKHKTLKIEEPKFWDFSWVEVGKEDLPATIDYILSKTNKKALHFVGHSWGTTVGFMLLSSKPEYNKKVLSMHCFAPVVQLAKVYQMVGPGGMVEEMTITFMDGFRKTKKAEYFPRSDNKRENWENQITCLDLETEFVPMCEGKMQEAYKMLGGEYFPAGTSFKCLEHSYQISWNGVIQGYNYTTEGNQKAYGSDEPCSYTDNFKKITVPTYLWSSEQDMIITTEDMDYLASLINNKAGDYRIKDDCFDHMAFLFPYKSSCMSVRNELYDKVMDAMKCQEKP